MNYSTYAATKEEFVPKHSSNNGVDISVCCRKSAVVVLSAILQRLCGNGSERDCLSVYMNF